MTENVFFCQQTFFKLISIRDTAPTPSTSTWLAAREDRSSVETFLHLLNGDELVYRFRWAVCKHGGDKGCKEVAVNLWFYEVVFAETNANLLLICDDHSSLVSAQERLHSLNIISLFPNLPNLLSHGQHSFWKEPFGWFCTLFVAGVPRGRDITCPDVSHCIWRLSIHNAFVAGSHFDSRLR